MYRMYLFQETANGTSCGQCHLVYIALSECRRLIMTVGTMDP